MTISIARVLAPAQAENVGKKVVFKNCAPFTDCISEINNTQIDNAKYIGVIMPMYNLIKHSDNYSKTSGSFKQYYRDEPALTNAGAIANFHAADTSASFKFKQKITGITGDDCTKNVEIMVPSKYLSNLWRTREMPLINCEINLILTWSDKFVLSNDTKAATFSIADAKLYVSVVTLSTQDNAKLLQQLKLGFKRTINWNKHQRKFSPERPNQYLDFLVDPSFQGVNRLFVLSFENENDRTVHTKYYLPTVEIKDYNVMIDGRNFFNQPVKNNLITYDNIRKTATGQGDDYTIGCLLDYNYFNNYYKMIAIGLSKQQALDADPKAIQQINFTGNLENTAVKFFINEESKETVLDFSQGTVKIL